MRTNRLIQNQKQTMILLWLFFFSFSQESENIMIKDNTEIDTEKIQDNSSDIEISNSDSSTEITQAEPEVVPFIIITPPSDYGIQSRTISYSQKTINPPFRSLAPSSSSHDTMIMVLISIVSVVSIVSIVVLVASIICVKKRNLAVNDIESDLLTA